MDGADVHAYTILKILNSNVLYGHLMGITEIFLLVKHIMCVLFLQYEWYPIQT